MSSPLPQDSLALEAHVTGSLPLSYRLGVGALVFAAFLTQAKFIPSIRNNIGPFEVIGILLIASFLLSSKTQRPLRLNRVTLLAFAILGIAVISQINIPEGRLQTGLLNVAIQIFFAFFLLTLFNLLQQHRVSPRTLLQFVALTLLVVGPWIIFSGITAQDMIQEAGPFRNRAHMASYMLTAFWLALIYSQWPGLRLRAKLVAYSGVAMTLYAVAASGRRSVYLSLVLGLAALGFFFLVATRQRRIRLFLVGLFVLGLIYAMYQYGPRYFPQLQFFQDRVSMIDDRLDDALAISEDSAARKSFFALQREGVQLAFRSHPIIGIGWGGFAKSHFSPTGHEVHSTPLRFLAETGLIGFALYLGLMLTLLASTWRAFLLLRQTPFANAYLVLAVGLSSLTVSYAYNRHVTERTFWLMVAVIFSMELFALRVQTRADRDERADSTAAAPAADDVVAPSASDALAARRRATTSRGPWVESTPSS